MPIYEYRCECGQKVEALVRGGREPITGDEAGHFCDTPSKLTKLLSAFAVGSSPGGAAMSAGAMPEACANCQCDAGGGCQYD